VTTAVTRAELLTLPAVVDIPTAGRAYGIGERLAYELARRGEFPVPVLRLGRLLRVRTADLLEHLEPRHSESGPATGPLVATADTATPKRLEST